MTITELHKRLGKLIQQGHGRKKVCVWKTSFQHNCEADGVVILDLAGLGMMQVPQDDGDGCIRINQDGTESTRQCLVLVGDVQADSKGDIVEEV
jgi:hypothetical protein